jgi:hypothetical protein
MSKKVIQRYRSKCLNLKNQQSKSEENRWETKQVVEQPLKIEWIPEKVAHD